jgi:hypothetical protein
MQSHGGMAPATLQAWADRAIAISVPAIVRSGIHTSMAA